MRIAVDIDNTLTDSWQYVIELGQEFCKKNHIIVDTLDLSKMYAPQIFQLEGTEWGEKLDKWSYPIMVKTAPIAIGAAEAIRELQRGDHTICIVTARTHGSDDQPYSTEQIIEDTHKWFETYDIYPAEWHFGIKQKGVFCREHEMDVMIDDEEHNIKNCIDNYIPIIIKSQPYNKHLKGLPGSIYAYFWSDIVKYINILESC